MVGLLSACDQESDNGARRNQILSVVDVAVVSL